MLKKLLLLTATLLSAGILPAQETPKSTDATILVLPCEETPLQIGQDICRRYQTLLVSYQTVRGNLMLHAWNGSVWVEVHPESYKDGTFFSGRPDHVVLVESRRNSLPELLIPDGSWCKSIYRLSSTETRTLIHLLGRHFDFPFRHWEQFANRYNYKIEEINPTLINVNWWNLQGDVYVEKLSKRDFSADNEYWYPVETAYAEPVSIPAAPVKKPELKFIPPVSTPAEPVQPEATDVAITAKPAPEPELFLIDADPFLVQEIPAAEVVASPEPKKSWWKK